MGKRKNLISRVTTLLDSNVQFSTTKKSQDTQRNRNVWPIQMKKYKPTETVPEKDLMVDLLDKDFNTPILKMLRELKEGMEKVKKTMSEQNGNINKEIGNLDRT